MLGTIVNYSATNGNVGIQQGDPNQQTVIKPSPELSRHSVMSLENASLLGSVVQPQDLQELMSNLERATGLVKRYLQENQGVDFGRK